MRALFVKSSFQNLVHFAVWILRRGRVVIPANRCLAQCPQVTDDRTRSPKSYAY